MVDRRGRRAPLCGVIHVKTAIIVAAVLYFPLVTIGTLAAMVCMQRGRMRNPNALRELVLVGAVVVTMMLAVPVLILMSELL